MSEVSERKAALENQYFPDERTYQIQMHLVSRQKSFLADIGVSQNMNTCCYSRQFPIIYIMGYVTPVGNRALATFGTISKNNDANMLNKYNNINTIYCE